MRIGKSLAPALTLLGLVVGVAITLTSPHRFEAQWWPWAVLATALVATAGACAALGLRRLEEIDPERHLFSWGDALTWVALLVVAGLAAVALLVESGWRGWALIALTLAGGLPGAIAVRAMRVAASRLGSIAPGDRTEWLIAARRTLRGLLVAGGALVSLSTLAYGASLAVPSFDVAPSTYVLVLGLGGSLLVGLAVAPVSAALSRASRDLGAELFPLTGLESGEEVLAAAARRRELDHLTGAEAGLLAELQSAVLVLAPLIAGAVSAWLGG